MRGWLAGFAALLIAAGSAGAAPTGTQLYDAARDRYAALAQDGPEARDSAVWRDLADAFARIHRDAHAAPRADDGLYMAGICLERALSLSSSSRDRDRAVAFYERLAQDYPASNLADDALLRAGRLAEARGDLAGARRRYRRLVETQPAGDMVPLARRRLARLGRTTRVDGIRSWSGPDYTRVVVDLSDSGPFEVRSLAADASSPARIYLDFDQARVGSSCGTCEPVSDGLVHRVRVGQHDRDTARVVLDLAAPASFRTFALDAPARVVVDVFRAPPADLVGTLIAPKPPRRLRVVVDPGHGGRDPGAVGPGGLLEKDVTLSLARDLAQLLSARLSCEVRLTRGTDRYLSLEERTAIANAFGADLFISVHANASSSTRARGVETYYLDRASDRAARRLAARENASGEVEVAAIEHILADVVLTTKLRGSRRLAEAVQEALVSRLSRGYGPVRDLGVKRGPFYVLTGAVMPAILVETSFITHPVEARHLADQQFRRDAAEAVAAGVEQFVEGG